MVFEPFFYAECEYLFINFQGWSYKLEADFLEIYNEEIRDLLATEKNLKYDVKMAGKDDPNGVVVTNLKVEEVTTARQIEILLKRAQKNRAVAATNCNERYDFKRH